jgi:2-keto-4-pentenoate hydratase
LTAEQLDPRIRRGLEAQVAVLGKRTGAGERRLGFKIALNDPRVQRALRIERPVIGHLASGTEVAAGGSHSLAGATRPAVEPEIAVHVGEDATIAGLAPALEVIDVDLPFDDLEQVMAANVFHRAVALGPVTEGRTSLDGLSARFLRDGREEQVIDVAAAGMAPGEVLALVSGYLSAVGGSLEPGDIIIGGSLVPALPAAPGGRFELQMEDLGSVAVELTPA